MADSTSNQETFDRLQDEIQTKKTGKVTIRDAQFLVLLEIRELLQQIEQNTRPA